MSVDRLVVAIASSARLASVGIGVDHVLAHAGLHRDHAHRVRDHVVQLLRDAEPLVGDRVLGFFVALAA